ncbi:MAG: aminopeptidase P N-terminal domain-containing protein [Bdellovibrionales bacterium]|nr:aminopeptidase P N-terminal domain-containing protein [Bdellovibrionales bacterium]
MANFNEIKSRKIKLKKYLQECGEDLSRTAVLVFANREKLRNHDVHYPFRQDTNFYYLTGFEEPDSVFLYRPNAEKETTLFVRDKDPERETWDGFRYGVHDTRVEFKVDSTYSLKDLESVMPSLLVDRDVLYYSLFHSEEDDEIVKRIVTEVRFRSGRSGKGNMIIKDPYTALGEMRIIKSEFEIDALRKAADISCEAHIELMKSMHVGVGEKFLHGLFLKEIMQRGAQREGYGSIMATGPNATTLHYVFNDMICQEGDLFLVDAGAEYNYYTGDVTRTYPVNGRFTRHQVRLYDSVLQIQKSLIEMVKPGMTLKEIGDTAIEQLTELMVEENLLKGNVKELITQQAYRKYYPHGIGHWLGSDVHDAGKYKIKDESRKLEPGMVFTIEPGIYIPLDDSFAPEELKGIGIRIEDNILVTPEGHENLTLKAPKEVSDLETIIGSKS